jgi:hypothetical protein
VRPAVTGGLPFRDLSSRFVSGSSLGNLSRKQVRLREVENFGGTMCPDRVKQKVVHP